MSVVPDLDPSVIRKKWAEKLRTAKDIDFPELKFWNYSACQHHETPDPTCEYRRCGGDLFSHQKVGISWLYLRERGILADVMGTGKTNQIFGLLALLKQRGELGGRALIVCQTPAAAQWLKEAARWVPGIHVEGALSGMTKQQRIKRYSQNWEVFVVGYHLAMQDLRILEKLAPDILVVDDVDPILNHANRTHRMLAMLSNYARRSIVINATIVQMRLQQLHAAGMLTDGIDIFGSLNRFENRYIRKDPVTVYNYAKGTKSVQLQVTGFKNMLELKEKVTPMILQRKYTDLDDIHMPALMPPQDVWLELYPEQRKRYQELQASVKEMVIHKAEGSEIKALDARLKVGYGQRICAGLPALGEPDGPQASVKLDWLTHALKTEWTSEKVVVFIQNLATIEAFENRLEAAGIQSAKIWGREASATVREAEVERFRDDPNCRVLMGTAAIERSLNLQCSNIMVFVDLFLNPARVAQTVGRVRRVGSNFDRVFVFNLLTTNTQEERYKAVLGTRQALSDFVFSDSTELFDQLPPDQLLELIGVG